MRYLSLLGVCGLFFLAGMVQSATAADTLVVPEKIAYAKKIRVRDAVRNECQLEEKTLRFIKEYAQKNGTYKNIVTEKPKSGTYHVLDAEIIRVIAKGGGAWSGSKSMTIKGTLKDQSGKQLGSFEAGRYSGGGAFAGYKGTCSIIGRCTKAIGKDVAQWLIDPQEDSYLGDL